MLQIRFDSSSSYALHFPRPHERTKVLALAQTFVAYDETQPEDRQSPYTPKLKALLEEMIPRNDQRLQGEAQRTVASDALKQLDDEASLIIDQIIGMMRVVFPTAPGQAERWGLAVKQRTGNILKPHKREARLALLNAYIKTEYSRPDYERFSLPDLDHVVRVRDELQTNLHARNTGKTQREVGIATGKALSLELHNHLQAAVVYLLSEQFNYKLTHELQNWGYTVVSGHNGRGHGHSHGQTNGASQPEPDGVAAGE